MAMSAALQIWSHTYSQAFDQLPPAVRQAVERKVDSLGTHLGSFPHYRLTGRAECRMRVGDYRVLYEFDVQVGHLYLHYVGHRREIYKRA